MRVEWSNTALAQLAALHTEAAEHSPAYAHRLIDRLTSRARQLATFPESGRIVPEFALQGLREIQEPPYRIIYLVSAAGVEIVALIHSARSIE